MPGVDGRRIVDGAEPEVALQDVGGTHAPSEAVPGAVDQVVETVEEHCDPADPALAHGDLEIGMLQRVLGPQPLGAGVECELAEQCGSEL